MDVVFFVPGVPATAGSKRAFATKAGRVMVTEDCKRAKPWRSDVITAAKAAYSGPPVRGPILFTVKFYLPRPKAHFGKRGLKTAAPRFPCGKPDRTKLLRAIEDALKGLFWLDDSQVVVGNVFKRYADDDRVGAWVRVVLLDPVGIPYAIK